jgi:hypothetical protein
MTRRSGWQRAIAWTAGALIVGWALLPAAATGRPLADLEMEAIIGAGGGGGGPPPPPPITFETSVSSSISSGGTATYRFIAPASGPGVVASFRVADETPPPAAGQYTLEVRLVSNGSLVATASGTGSVLLNDVAMSLSTSYDVKVIDTGGTAPRGFVLTMGPRYSLPAFGSLSFSSNTGSKTLNNAAINTYTLDVASNQLNCVDIYFDDTGIAGGTAPDNIVTVVAPDRVTILAKDLARNDLSLDCSEFPGLKLAQTGQYLVLVSNTSTTANGTYVMYTGPYLGQDDSTAPCDADVLLPVFPTPDTTASRQLSPVGDRDVFCMTIPEGAAQVSISLNQSGTAQARNELRLSKADGTPVLSKIASGSFTMVATVDVGGGDYLVEVNNLENGVETYTVTAALTGPCIDQGTGNCTLVPQGQSIKLQPPTNTWSSLIPIRATPSGGLLATNENATFQLDKTGTGTMTLQVVRPNLTVICSGSDNSDFIIENCDLESPDGDLAVRVFTSNGAQSAIVRMGPLLLNKTQEASQSAPTLRENTLATFGDEDIFPLTLANPGQLGVAFDDQGMGPDHGQVRICLAANLEACLKHDPGVIIPGTQVSGALDFDAPAVNLAAGSYIAIVDNLGTGDGDYAVCFGSGDDQTDIERTGNATIPIFGDLPAGGTIITRQSSLVCGDSDLWEVSTNTTQAVRIEVREDDAVTGKILADLTQGGSPVASASGTTAASIVTVTLTQNVTYVLRVDNDKTGAPSYTIRIADPQTALP